MENAECCGTNVENRAELYPAAACLAESVNGIAGCVNLSGHTQSRYDGGRSPTVGRLRAVLRITY